MKSEPDSTSPSDPERTVTCVPGPFQRINALCESFSTEWNSGRPNLSTYLREVNQDDQPTLLRNLLEHDIQNRRDLGEQPETQDYAEQLPEHQDLIRAAFFDTEPNSSTADLDTTSGPAASRVGAYRLLREVGRGGMGEVFEAIHLDTHHRVALKMLPTVSGNALHRFKQEFRTVAEVSHPNLVTPYTLECDGTQWFITMELIQGTDFLTFTRPEEMLDEDRLRDALSQLIAGIAALHGEDIVHQDLKPGNVMVSDEGRVRILDFGLASELRGSAIALEGPAGTPAYMAPEQAIGGWVTPATDWYAVGVMLYQALTGERSFQGNAQEMLRARYRMDPPPPPTGSGIPADLAELSVRLMNRDPDDRPDAAELTAILSQASSDVSPSENAFHGLIGRDNQVAQLREVYREFHEGEEPVVLFVTGRSGDGKTSLCEHFLEPLHGRLGEVKILSGRCYDRESVPFKALDSLIDDLTAHLRSLPQSEAKAMIPPDVSLLAELFPVLRRVRVIEIAPKIRVDHLSGPQIRHRAVLALRQLLTRLSEQVSLVIFIDDLQWGDADSARLLAEVFTPPDAPRVFLLGTYRSDEVEGSRFLGAWEEARQQGKSIPPFREISLSPLSIEECTDLLIAVMGNDSPEVRSQAVTLAEQTGGNPLLMTELATHHLSEMDSGAPFGLEQVLRRKLDLLPSEATPLLEVTAVSGQPIRLSEVLRAGDVSDAAGHVTHLRNQRLLRTLGAERDPLLDTYHDKIREATLVRMGEDVRRHTHLRLATVIEKISTDPSIQNRAYDLAYHYDAAEQADKAVHYAVLAAEQARGQHSLEVAVAHYAIAQRHRTAADPSTQHRISRGHGEALMLLGRYEPARNELGDAISSATNALEAAEARALLGELAFKQGQIPESVTDYETALSNLGSRVPRGRVRTIWELMKESCTQFRHSMSRVRPRRGSCDEKADLTNRLFARLDYSYWFSDTLKLLWSSLAGLNHAERLPKSPSLAFQYAVHGNVMMVIGHHSRAARYYERSLELSRELNDVWAEAHSRNHAGIGCCAAARYEEGLTQLRPAAEGFQKAGDVWELYSAYFHIGWCQLGLGDLAGTLETAQWAFDLAVRSSENSLHTSGALLLWARAKEGALPFEELKARPRHVSEHLVAATFLNTAEGHWHLRHGRTAEAVTAFERAWEEPRRQFCINFHTLPALSGLVTALRVHAETIEEREQQEAQRVRRRALRLARWAVRLSWFAKSERPHALREMSLLHAAQGKLRKAWVLAGKSCQAAAESKARYEYAQSLMVCGKLGQKLGRSEAEVQIREASIAIEAIRKQD